MAKLVGPLHSSEARGRLGGVIYNSYRGKSTAKSWKSPSQPRSAAQMLQRAFATTITRAWSLLTPLNRTNWNNYAVAHLLTDWTGQPKRITGANWYMRCSSLLKKTGSAVQANSPTDPAPDAVELFSAATGILQSVLTWTAGGPTTTYVQIMLVGPHTAGSNPTILRAKHNSFIYGNLGTATVNGLLKGTETFFARRVSALNGLASPWVKASAVITSA